MPSVLRLAPRLSIATDTSPFAKARPTKLIEHAERKMSGVSSDRRQSLGHRLVRETGLRSDPRKKC